MIRWQWLWGGGLSLISYRACPWCHGAEEAHSCWSFCRQDQRASSGWAPSGTWAWTWTSPCIWVEGPPSWGQKNIRVNLFDSSHNFILMETSSCYELKSFNIECSWMNWIRFEGSKESVRVGCSPGPRRRAPKERGPSWWWLLNETSSQAMESQTMVRQIYSRMQSIRKWTSVGYWSCYQNVSKCQVLIKCL